MTTNALRIVRSLGMAVETRDYPVDEGDLTAASVAAKVGMDPDRVFKTLAVVGERTGPFLCCVPASAELDLRKAAAAAEDKAVTMLPLKELETLTGYVRGGCSPVGTKKRLRVFLDETAMLWDTVSVSAGARGLQMILAPGDLVAAAGAELADLC